jgi:hypothetical protein
MDGSQSDAFTGYWDALTNGVSGGHGSDYGVNYGHQTDYNNVHYVGEGAAFVINAAVTVSGIGGVVKGVQAIRAAGGLLQIAQVALNDGRLVPVIVVNGQAIVATVDGLVHAGVAGTAAANIIHQMTTSGGGPASGPTDPVSNPRADALGKLVDENVNDPAAQKLAQRIGGRASVRFENGPPNKFDAVSDQYVAQSKPGGFKVGSQFRNSAKATFEAAVQTGRQPYFHFDGPPDPAVIAKLQEYATRFGIQPVIDTKPF